jgi:hypothetical protein
MTRQLDSLSLHDSQKTKISPQSPPTTLAPSGKLLFLKQTTKILTYVMASSKEEEGVEKTHYQ